MSDSHHASNSQGLNNEASFPMFPPSNPFSTPRTGTSETSAPSHAPHPEQPSPAHHPRKGSFTETFPATNDLPPAYSPETWRRDVQKGPQQHGAPLRLPPGPSLSVFPASRLPGTNRDPPAAEIDIAMGQHERNQQYMNEGHNKQGYYGYCRSWHGPGWGWNTPYGRKVQRRKMIAAIVVFVSSYNPTPCGILKIEADSNMQFMMALLVGIVAGVVNHTRNEWAKDHGLDDDD